MTQFSSSSYRYVAPHPTRRHALNNAAGEIQGAHDVALAHAVLKHRLYLANVRFVQWTSLCSPMLIAARHGLGVLAGRLKAYVSPTLLDRIVEVVGYGAEKQMPRVAARRIVTSVTDLRAIEDSVARMAQQPRDYMRSAIAVVCGNPKGAVTIRNSSSGPFPTIVRAFFGNLAPETFGINVV